MRQYTRDYPRHSKRLRFSFRNRGKEKWLVAYSKDISVSGIFLMSGKMPVKEPIELDVEIGDQKLSLEARLVWGLKTPMRLQQIAKGGFGLQITTAPKEWYEYCLTLEKPKRQSMS